VEISPLSNQPEVACEFNAAGATILNVFTSENVSELLAIYADGKILAVPTILEPITGGKINIAGDWATTADARLFAALLNSGELPCPLRVVSLTKTR
jgi:preprotein translocase subunit SecD